MKVQIIIGICVACAVLLVGLIILLILLLGGENKKPSISAIEIAQQKCNDYAKVACNNPVQSTRILFNELSRVTEGRNVAEGTFPHMVRLDVPDGCSGTLISEYFVMTSANCVNNTKKQKIRLKMGAVDLLGDFGGTPTSNDLFDNRTGAIYYTDEVIRHEKYNLHDKRTWVYNIALLKLATKVEFDWKKRPICLNTNYSSIERKNMTTSGWGFDEKSSFTNHLQAVDQYIDEEIQSKCLLEPQSIGKCMICVGNRDNSAGICGSDMGSPLQIPLKNRDACANTYEQIGVAIAHHEFCSMHRNETLLGLYTEIGRLIDWIAPLVWPESFKN